MKERPILFNGEMVRAILEGRKTQTRRIIKGNFNHMRWCPIQKSNRYDGWEDEHGNPYPCPFGVPGDRLWVRETWRIYGWHEGEPFNLQYKADGSVLSEPSNSEYYDEDKYTQLGIDSGDDCERAGIEPDNYGVYHFEEGTDLPTRWRPSIHMPRWASRITLEITGVRVERLHKISEEDARAEGIDYLFNQEDCETVVGIVGTKPEDHGYKNYLWHGDYGNYGMGNKQSDSWPYQFSGYKDAVGSFSSLWEKIHAKLGYPWASNPWVWVIEFRRLP